MDRWAGQGEIVFNFGTARVHMGLRYKGIRVWSPAAAAMDVAAAGVPPMQY